MIYIIFLLALFSESAVTNLNQEILKMMHFDHPNVMPLIGVCIDGTSPVLIMPYMANGSVLEYVKHHKNKLKFTYTTEKSEVYQTIKIILTEINAWNVPPNC